MCRPGDWLRKTTWKQGRRREKKTPDPRVAIWVQQRFRSSCTAFLVNSEQETKRSARRGNSFVCLTCLKYIQIFSEKSAKLTQFQAVSFVLLITND